MLWEALNRYRDEGLLILRVGFGLGFLHYHGWQKLMGGPASWAERGEAMANFGITFGNTFWGFMNAFVESIGGLMFAAGFLFRPICILAFINMVVAATGHYVSGRGTPGHAMKNAFLFLGIFFVGPGRYSVDHWIAQKLATKGPSDVSGSLA